MDADESHPRFCLATVAHALGGPPPIEDFSLPSSDTRAGIFVTFKHRGGGALRGCIGSLSPTTVKTGLGVYARKAAFEDPRFPSISSLKELDTLSCGVSFLSDFRKCDDCFDWNVGEHGIIAEYQGKSATYLPEVAIEQEWSKTQTLESLKRKGGFVAADLSKISVTRYRSSKATAP